MLKRLVFILPIVLLFLLWLVYMQYANQWGLFNDNWFMSVTMIAGSFIAGASSEGGGAIAFPVMTLAFDISPIVARNFSLAIQAIGMTSASLLILYRKITIEKRYIFLISCGGLIGIVLGTIFLAPYFLPAYVKVFFVTLWLSFGAVLFYGNEVKKKKVSESLSVLTLREKSTILLIGIIGGAISALLGSGIDILSFSYITLRYRISEKVATPTSVIIMAINSFFGFILHYFVIKDFGNTEFTYWLVCIPVVIIGAPLGVYFISKRTRKFIAKLLYIIIVVQFIGAFFIIKPSGDLLWFSVIVFLVGMALFYFLNRIAKKTN